MVLAPTWTNLPYITLAQLPVAPALAAGLYAVRGWRADPDDGPFALFLRGYRRNCGDVLRWWVPTVLVTAVLMVNIAHAGAVPGGQLARPVAVALAACLLLWSGHVLVLTSFFSFRTRDAARLGIVGLFTQWRATLGMISLLVVAAGIAYFGTGLALLALAWALVSMLEHTVRTEVATVTRNFTVEGQ